MLPHTLYWVIIMKKKRRREKNPIYRFTMLLMVCILSGLLFMINDKKQIITMSAVRNFKIGDLSKLMFWENFFPKDEEAVSAKVNYSLLKEHYYTNGSNEVNALLDGVVVKVEKDTILELCDNGVSISYEKLKNVQVKKNDRLLSGDELGSMEESVVLRFYINDKEISKDKALSIK